MKMTRRNFLSTSAVAAFACGASLTAHAAGSTDENSLNFITDIFKDSPQPGEIEEATAITAEKNAEWYEKLDFSDRREFANAERGWLDNAEGKIIYAEDGKFAWDLQSYGDLNRDAPDTVNPSLWRNTQLNAKAGLFEVCDGIYQVRGFDMANATFIRTNNGWIIFDVLMCKENMQAAKALMENRFGPLDVKAVLYSHSHVDHFGGAEGAIDRNNVADPSLSVDKQLASGKTVILAPKGFLKHAIRENVYAGIAMARRAQYQYGTVLEKGEKGALSIGIGMGQSTGHVSLIAPTYEIGEDVPKLTIDGLEIEFQLTPGTEAPAEMNAYFPKYRALWMAENCTGTLHNLYTLRGAEVRDANDWAKYIIEADQRFCSKTDVVFQSHNWPHWGEEIHEYLLNTAAIYKFIHDQTLHYMNQGYTSNEIAAMISLPDALEKVWYTRQYYGTLPHNAKAIYQKYLGWYDANPVNLDPLPPSDAAKKLVEYLGSTELVLCLSTRPEFLLLDESFDGLDPAKRILAKKLLLEYVAERGASVIISSHNLHELEDLCDHVGLLDGQKLLLDCSVDDISASRCKFRVAFNREMDRDDFSDFSLKRFTKDGRLITFTVQGDIREQEERLRAMNPILLESFPLSLEEIFMDEMEGEEQDYADIFK